MTTALQRREAGAVETYGMEQAKVDLIKRTIAKGATDDELQLFLYHCAKTGLDPMAKQIYFRKTRSRGEEQLTIITGIDGYRLIADRTGKYAGSDEPEFDDETNPTKATVTVYKLVGGVRCPFTASARWAQYYPGDSQGFMWRKMPHHMLAKCAEALALRKAFPAELGGLYTKEEMDQARGESVEDGPQEPILVNGNSAAAPEPAKKKLGPNDYDDENLGRRRMLEGWLKTKGMHEKLWEPIRKACHGQPLDQAKTIATRIYDEACAAEAEAQIARDAFAE